MASRLICRRHRCRRFTFPLAVRFFQPRCMGFFLTGGNSLQIFLIFIAFARKWNCFKCIWVLLSFSIFFPRPSSFFISSAMLDISGLLSRFVLFGMPNACKTICSSLFVLLFLWNSFRVYYFVLLGSSWRDLVEIHSVYLAQTCKGFRLCFLFSKHFPHFSCALSRPILT